MKVIIIAGGLGTRISEETDDKPKPMVLINGQPILWHLMNIFSLQGFNDFIISTGYKSDVIEKWVNTNTIFDSNVEKMSISTINTGLHTQTGGRISEVMKVLPNERVIATYGDGLANVSIEKLLDFHTRHGKLATVTAVRPPARFGYMKIEENTVTHFGEKNQSDEGWINGGFFVIEPAFFDLIEGDSTLLEREPLERAAKMGELMSFKHHGFWQCMDTKRDQELLEMLWEKGAPWKN